MNIYLRLLKYIKPYIFYVIGAFICMLLLSACNILLIPLVGKLFDAIGSKNFFLLNIVALGALGLYFIRGIFMYGQTYLMSFAGQGIVRDLRVQVFKHVHDLSLDFFTKWRSGEVISRIITDINVMQGATVQSVTKILPNVVTLIGVIGYLLYLNWRLTLITTIILPLILFTVTKFGQKMREVATESRKKAADIASVLQETISAVHVVKSFTMEKHEVKKFTKHSNQGFWLALQEAVIDATQTPILGFIQALAIVVVVWYGGYEVVSGRLDPSNLIAFFAGIALLAEPMTILSSMNVIIQRSVAASSRVFEVIDIEPSVKEAPNAKKLGPLKGRVEFKNVSFKYDNNEEMILKDIDLNVKPGEIIALVGPSGAGKSTFVSLIPRFYDTKEGAILIDGNDVRSCEIYSMRSQIGLVPQETMLFSGPVKDNIAYGKISANKEEIIAAAKKANAHDFIMAMPDKYDTLVGERGIRLSGGERQRVAIARALLRDPRILILDEATSSLDTESERLVQDALEKLMVGRTTFVIAHRLSTVQFANRILVLDKGAIVEQGSHKDLLEKGGLYKKLYEMQFRDEEEPSKQKGKGKKK